MRYAQDYFHNTTLISTIAEINYCANLMIFRLYIHAIKAAQISEGFFLLHIAPFVPLRLFFHKGTSYNDIIDADKPGKQAIIGLS